MLAPHLGISIRSVAKRGLATALFACTALAIVCSAGCRDSNADKTPTVNVSTPEGKLEMVMERLQSAFDDAETPASYGVVSKRRCAYEMLPVEDDGVLRANVFVASELELNQNHTKQAVNRAKTRKKPPAPNQGAPRANVSGEGTAAEIIEESKSVTRNTYTLVFDNDRWTMPERPEEEFDQIAFDFALGK